MQIVKALQQNDFLQRAAFATTIFDRIGKENKHLQRVAFSDEASFHTHYELTDITLESG